MSTVGSGVRIAKYRDRDLGKATTSVLDVSTVDELQFAAWWLHETVLERAKHEHAPQHMYDGIAGYRWDGNVNQIVHTLWPDTSTNPHNDAAREAKVALNSFLRQTRNMVCLTPGNQATPSTWWVRATFSEDLPAVPVTRSRRPAEVKLTPAEAGETVTPAPVTTAFLCPHPGCTEGPFPDKARRTQHYFLAHRPVTDFMLAALRDLGRPARVTEVQLAAERDGYPGSLDSTRRALSELSDEGKVVFTEVRPASGPGGSVYMYALPEHRAAEWELTPAKEVPRISSGNYECREPGCTIAPFESADERRSHENQSHPDMTSRKYPCKQRGCRDRFYSMPALAIHLGSGHHISRDTVRFRTLLEAAIAEAEGQPQAEVDAEPATPPAPAKPPAVVTVTKETPAPGDPIAAVQAIVAENHVLKEENRVLRARTEELQGRLDAITAAIQGVQK